uniref:protein disulfide-isomerase n=1 Tax=Heterosigma akashiwo TaxID=2829 RepID=A0A7S3UPC4_HETAK
MMFLNLQGTVVNPLADYVPGKTGNLSNNELVMELREAAKDHFGRISFVYIDGIEHADRMKALGLYGGQERLPALALNTKDGKKLPFPEVLPINRDTILQFCADYLSGRMNNEDDAQEMAKKALMATNFNRKNQAQRQERKKPPEEKTGISEQWKKKDPVVQITSDNFEEIVLDEDRDVVVLFTSKECESCSHMTPYYKRLGRRFAELEQEEGGLGGGNVTVGVMDLADDTPPLGYATVLVADLPLVVLFPARDKGAPFRYYSGVSKVRPMMEWVAQHSGSGVVLPRLPHLNEEDRQLFKEQVREREEYKAKKKAEEEAAMEEEQRRLEEFRRQKKKARVEEEEENPHHHEEEGQGEEKHHNKVDRTIFSANSGGQEHDDDDGDIPTVASLDDNNEDGDGYSDYYEYDEL